MPHATFKDNMKSLLRHTIGVKAYEKLVFHHHLGYWPNIENPTSFCEKLIHRKLYCKDERFVVLSDKVAVRDYVREKCGDKILTHLHGVLSKSSELPKDLPSEFFMKATYGSGINLRVNDYTIEKRPEIMSAAEDMLRQEHVYGRLSSQWWYESIPKRLMLEEIVVDSKGCLPLDYKFYCFDGKVHQIHVDFDRFGDHTRSHFDRNWNFLPYSSSRPQGPDRKRPENLEEMIEIAEILGQGFDFVSVDLYSPDETRIVFGEMTFTPAAGWVLFSPSQEPDWEIGKLWNIQTS